ncbi:hypothetical protein KJ359_008523 [Pestalotiopsis sp. 9143b]|nr:hypothetical protein KJ359_008523 [Pestalotiopsis sp. 9143b]
MALYDKSREFFMKKELSDFKLTYNGREVSVHRMILALHSEFFRRAFSSDFKEAKEGVMDFPDDDPEILEKVLSIMYRGNYDDKYYGKMTGSHTAVTMTLKELRLSAEGGRRSYGRHEPDFDASLAIIQDYEEDRPREDG